MVSQAEDWSECSSPSLQVVKNRYTYILRSFNEGGAYQLRLHSHDAIPSRGGGTIFKSSHTGGSIYKSASRFLFMDFLHYPGCSIFSLLTLFASPFSHKEEKKDLSSKTKYDLATKIKMSL